MKEISFTQKTCNELFSMSSSNATFRISKPMLCPICGAFQDGKNMDRKLFSTAKHGVVSYECTHCHKRYLAIFNVDLDAKQGSFGALYPTVSVEYKNEILATVSQRFMDSYNQSLRAERIGDIELASVGFRQALECLVKDYAVNVLGEDRSTVAKKSLFEAIEKYLSSADLVKTADVIRILGNDYAHYERKYPEIDFDLLKRYMKIFISLVETQVLIKNPPVSR